MSWSRLTVHPLFVFTIVFLSCGNNLSLVNAQNVPRVTSVTPKEGSKNGGTRITIHGENFAETLFTLGDEDVGNTVTLTSLEAYDCPIHPDGTHASQITCYTTAMPVGVYKIKVSVNGVDILDEKICSSCTFSVKDSRTPTITSVMPRSGPPGEVIKVTGNILTDKYGSNIPDETEAKILRVFFGGQKCELRKSIDEMYGLEYSPTDSEGHMMCKTEGTFIGNNYVSYMLSNEYGRSAEDGLTKYPRSNGISMYQTFAEITGISLNKGSIAGGTLITITGKHFDETDMKAKVDIAGSECAITAEVSDTTIECKTAIDPSEGMQHFTGGRGFQAYVHPAIVDASTIDKSTAPMEYLDSSEWTGYNISDHSVLMTGYFIPVHAGTYSFCHKSASRAKVYVSADGDPANKTMVSDGTNTCGGSLAPHALDAGQRCYIEAHYSSDQLDSYVTVIAYVKETDYSETDTEWAEHEKQKFIISSNTDPEIQEVEVASPGNFSVTPDVQEIRIGGDPSSTFVIGLDGIYTTEFSLSSLNADDLLSALKKLPSVVGDIQVDVTDSGSDKVAIITSSFEHGLVGDYEGMLLTGLDNSLTFNYSRTFGAGASTHFALTMNGTSTEPLEFGSTANKVKSALEDLFSVQCHPKLKEGTLETFEVKNGGWKKNIVSDTEPFCDRFSLKNPSYLFYEDANKKLRLSTTGNRYVCFAYKGAGGLARLLVKYENFDENDESRVIHNSIYINNPDENLEQWNYWCEDIYTILRTKVPGTLQIIKYIRAYKKENHLDLYMDQFAFRKNTPIDPDLFDKISMWRKPQVQPMGYLIDTVAVTKTGNTYQITMTPHHCGHNFNLFEVLHGNVTQVQEASIPIVGGYRILFKDEKTEEIPVTLEVEPKSVTAQLEATKMGYSEVVGTGTCSTFNYIIKMVSLTGDQPDISIDGSQLTGDDVQISVRTLTSGGLWLNPIMGDLLRTHHTKPQVLTYINGVPTRCADGDVCDFVWADDVTPTIDSVNPTTGSKDQTITITGTGFDESVVTIGQTPCDVTSSSPTSLECTLGDGPTGPAPVKVNVMDKGYASGNVSFTFITGVTTFDTVRGSLEGGTVLTISGYGFTPDAEVKVDGNPCTITDISESDIKCVTPRAASLSTTTVTVTVTQIGNEDNAGSFIYDPAFTPIISSVNVTSSSVAGGDNVAIVGTDFGNIEMPVTLGGERMEVVSYSDTEIIAVLPPLPHGSYRLVVDVEGKGYADLRTNAIPNIDYDFTVTAMFPNLGSAYGGTDLTIQGSGFDESLLEVTVGQHECKLTTVDDSNILCRIAPTGIQHHVFANGTHKHYGKNFAWDQNPLTVSVGDTVTWHWETPFYVNDVSYSVRQTQKADDLVDMPGGFSSGANTRKGTFSHTFTVAGTYNYWTGYLDSNNALYFRGKTEVVPIKSSRQIVSVKMLGHEASYDTSGSGTPPSVTCTGVSSTLTDCVDDEVLEAVADKFSFDFSKCHSPFFDSQSLTEGSFDDVISVQGKGFGDQDCQNVISYGDEQMDEDGCTEIVSSSVSSVDFKISPSCQPPINELHKFNIRVQNLGYALMSAPTVSGMFGLVPLVIDIQPASGSKVGGTKVTITGAGFMGDIDNVLVEFQSLSCDIESMSYTQIVCTTKCASEPSSCHVGEMSFTVTVGSRPANCDVAVCVYTTSEAETPEVSDVQPASVSDASTELVITGTKFASDPSVFIGDVECTVTASTTTQVTCNVGRLPVGDNSVNLFFPSMGKAATTLAVAGEKLAAIGSPAASSTQGGATLVVDGNGFVDGNTEVTVNGDDCTDKVVTLAQVKCTLPPQSAGTHSVVIVSNGHTYDSLTLDYTAQATPVVSSITPDAGAHTDTLTIAGQALDNPVGGAQPKVTIGESECVVTASTSTSITCTAGVQSTGVFPVRVFVEEKGFSDTNLDFTYELSAFTVSPAEGSTNGGQLITLSGSGFLDGETNVKVCGVECPQESVTSSQVVCRTTANTAQSCDVVAEVQGTSYTASSVYTYNAALVSTVTGVTPSRGGTGGGTTITIAGSNFGISSGDIEVMIADSVCAVQSVTDTQIVCVTGSSSKSVMTEVAVQKSGQGLAEQTDAAFEYIDVWSSLFTWGGTSLPEEGDFIIIPKGQKILLDIDTPVMAMLLIQGGHLVFDEKDVELEAKYILITDGGILEVGTEEKPFEHKAIITLHGHVRSKELPVYGAKGIGVREGRLELHGQHIPQPWTYLSSTAAVAATTIDLVHEVNWKVGDEIVIATTGDRLSQKESEVRTIQSISSDNLQLTLTEALEYEHISTTATFGSRTVEFRAEVGLLTRNVVVRGHRNVEFDHTVEACPEGFNPGEFSTQTCFQGRFGEEVGSDQYGVHILIHQQDKDTQVAQAHIENTEVTHAGQAFRLGRYPIHFHLNGNMSESYVRRCAIHHTFNRAVNIHGSHHTTVEHNVVYNAMGGALFLEDGNEIGNTFQYNLEILIKSSTSLLNDDITPAAIWATNPNNIIRHNAAAGGTHFGVWYRMHKHPDGPGFTSTICPQNIPLGEYSNNTAHSLGWFGLWIFETYIPKDSQVCSDSAPHKVAKFYSLTAWNNNEGAEAVNAGAIQFHDFVIVNNQKSSIHFSLIRGKPPQYDPENGPGVFDSIIVARHNGLKGLSSAQGIVQPHYNGFMVKDVEFHNFDQTRSTAFTWVTIAGVCTKQCGGFTTAVSGVTFTNSPNKVRFAWVSEGVIKDLDGSLTGTVGGSAVACSGSFDQSKCTAGGAELSRGVDGCVCTKDVKLIRFAFNNIQPKSLLYKTAQFKSEHGTTLGPWFEKRISHKKGWQVVLQANTSYDMSFENAEHAVNISYDGTLYSMADGDYITLSQNVNQMPDILQLDGSNKLPMSNTIPEGDGVQNGDWSYNNSKITYAIKNEGEDDIPLRMRAVRCYFRGCKKPASPLAITKQPENAEYTSMHATWNNLTKHGGPAKAGDDLYIAYERWIVVDSVLPKLGKVVIEGGLQFAEDFLQENQLEADHIYIKGRLVAGWSDEKPFDGKLTIRLRGDHSTPNIPQSDGPNLGAKFIGVFGGLDLHGKTRAVTKTFLSSEATKGDGSITVKDAVDWQVDEEILITTTDYDAWHTEIFKITGVSGNTISLNGTIQHRHISHQETIDGKQLELSARVALLSRNIRVEGAEYPNLIDESFGARIVVGQTFADDKLYSGFARVSNVEFYHCGQEGFSSSSDSRYALTYIGVTSTEGTDRYSYARHNAFHNGFSPAIGVYNTDGLEIDDNTIHHTVGPGIQVEATGVKLTNNLVTLSIWPGAYLDRKESENYDFSGGIEARKANDLVLMDNTVAGSERAAYSLPGQACSAGPSDLWSGNMASGAQSGIVLLIDDKPVDTTCTQYSGFILWKNFDYGLYYNNKANVVVKGNIFIENSVGVTPFIVGPSSTSHQYADKSATIQDNVFIGKTSTFSETLDVLPTGDNIAMSGQARGASSKSPCGKVGIMSATFTSGSNGAARKPWLNVMAYQAIGGVTIVKGNHFINYGACTGGYDHAIGTNKNNDDVIHPMVVSGSTLTNVEKKAKILFHIPNVGKINPSDCVDMDCDAHKKCLVTDTDGTFLGFVGNVLPEAAYEWDGDRRHGLGDYRIPTPLLTTVNGKKLDTDNLKPGLYKFDECTWIEEWVAYECDNDLKWRMLVAESMDSDTEMRRISPVAVYHKEGGYIDLVNGPQDHGWCSGYTCQKRLSTFPILVALDQPFELFLTGTNPRKMRYMIINSQPTECVRLSMWYNTINRLEVKVDGEVVLPNNGFYDDKGRYRVKFESTEGEFMPDPTKQINGENYVDQNEQIIYWVTCGGSEVVVTRLDALLVSFTLPQMDVDEFFGEGLVENLAGFLGIDPKRVRIVNVVSAATKRRRRRSADVTTVYIEISDTPDEAPSMDVTEVGDQIINLVQFGSVSEVLKVEVLYAAITVPDSDSDDPIVLQKPGSLVLETPPEGFVSEDKLLRVQPKLKVTDANGDVVTHLGSPTLVWEIEASIKSGGLPRSGLTGTTRMNFTNGWANFTDLAIDDMGDDYIIEFQIVSPPEAVNYTIDSSVVHIFGMKFRPKATLLQTKRLTDASIELEVGLVDKDTELDFTDIAWDGHTWDAKVEIYDAEVYSGSLSGDTEVAFDPDTGKATFTNILLDTPGNCPLLVTITSDPAGYTLKMVVTVDLITAEQDSLLVEESHNIQFRFPITYNEERAPFWADQVANHYGKTAGLKITHVDYRAGSTIVILYVEASKTGYNTTLFAMCGDIESGKNFTFDGTTVVMSPEMNIDGKPYYGVSCGPRNNYHRPEDSRNTEKRARSSGDELDMKYIIIIVVLSVVILILAIVLIYKCHVQPKAKTNVLSTTSTTPVSGHYYKDRDLLADVLLREETDASFKSWTTSTKPPMATAHPQSPFDLRGSSVDPTHRTPSPAWTK